MVVFDNAYLLKLLLFLNQVAKFRVCQSWVGILNFNHDWHPCMIYPKIVYYIPTIDVWLNTNVNANEIGM